jgi:hypothetical protein
MMLNWLTRIMHQRGRKRHAHLAVIPRAAVIATAPAATATARFVAIHADLSKKRCRSPRNTSIDVGSHPKKIDKYQDDINDPQRGFSRNVVEPPRIPQTLTSFDLRVHLWSSLHDFVIGDGTWHPPKASPQQCLWSSQFAALADDADIR